ncbi:hypothetical protein B0H63DRAFT_495294 [Podospora didyma]|uniref:DUF8212 domain-containing protein n=1 Tax=Podospora didyma TaxID=330526 RepID=A0AAE0TW36_9PEZI|nr:hypothetical protein B0H63DRAFT_495294 [Podospora didyma]
MRLLNTATMKVQTFMGSTMPKYAILPGAMTKSRSRTCSLSDISLARASRRSRKPAASAELSEAINSMFQWYQQVHVCYIYLADLPPDSKVAIEDALPKCKYFTRGWTLQELIAPRDVHVYDSTWTMRGTRLTLVDPISDITSVGRDVLMDSEELYFIPVATKMSWASKCNTTRVEDIAYSLLGIFDANMPLLYGEGHKAFRRLQEEVMRKTKDLTLLIWIRHGFGPGNATTVSTSRTFPASTSPITPLSSNTSRRHSHYSGTCGTRPGPGSSDG